MIYKKLEWRLKASESEELIGKCDFRRVVWMLCVRKSIRDEWCGFVEAVRVHSISSQYSYVRVSSKSSKRGREWVSESEWIREGPRDWIARVDSHSHWERNRIESNRTVELRFNGMRQSAAETFNNAERRREEERRRELPAREGRARRHAESHLTFTQSVTWPLGQVASKSLSPLRARLYCIQMYTPPPSIVPVCIYWAIDWRLAHRPILTNRTEKWPSQSQHLCN